MIANGKQVRVQFRIDWIVTDKPLIMTWKKSLILFVALLSGCLSANDNNSNRKVHKMQLKRSSNDQENSATGYIYRQDGHGPPSIVYLNAGQVDGHFAGKPLPYSYPNGLAKSYVVRNSGLRSNNGYYHNAPYTQYPSFHQSGTFHSQPPAQAFVRPQVIKPLVYKPHDSYPPIAYKAPYTVPYVAPVKIAVPVIVKHQELKHEPVLADYKSAENGGSSEVSSESVESSHEDDDSGSHENYGEDLRRYGNDDFNGGDFGLGGSDAYTHHGGSEAYTHHGDGDHGHHDSHFDKKGGSDYGEEQFAKHGHKGGQGYDNEHKYSKGDKGSHAKEHHEGYYDHHGGKKASEYDEANHHGEHHKGEKGTKGGKFGEKKHHKKGSKTTGYHNVFHKDEYKKDHTFYDDADHKGHFNKYGSDHKHHKGDEGKHASGAHHEAAHHEDQFGKKGKTEKGHYDKADEGYKKKHGHDGHHAHAEDYGKKGGAEYGNEHHYAKHGGHGGH